MVDFEIKEPAHVKVRFIGGKSSAYSTFGYYCYKADASIEEIKNCSVVPKAYLFSTALQVTTAMIQSVVVLPSSLVTVNSFMLSTNSSPGLIL